MTAGKDWTEDEVTLALGVYSLKSHKGITHFQKQLAEQLNRSDGAVGRKLGNLASLDPNRNGGLLNGGNTDRVVWNKYFDGASNSFDIEALVSGIRSASQNLGISPDFFGALVHKIDPTISIELLQDTEDQSQPASPTDTAKKQFIEIIGGKTHKVVVTRRDKQSVFRQYVLENFDGKCAISGLDEKRLLEAAHIRPWSEFEEGRVDIRNGIALNVLLHRAYDANLLGIDGNLRVWISPALKKEPYFAAFEGKTIPIKQGQIAPLPEYLAKRFEEFQSACSKKAP